MGCGIFAIGCILEIAPRDVLALFVIGRLVAGLGVGFISAILILYMVRSLIFISRQLMYPHAVGNCTKEGPRCSRLGVSILHNHRHPHCELRGLWDTRSARYQLVSHSHWHPISLGSHPRCVSSYLAGQVLILSRWWSIFPTRIPAFLGKERRH
jgi:hypothetical protein